MVGDQVEVLGKVHDLFYIVRMSKRITDNQVLGAIGETAVRQRFLSMGFQFDGRSPLEAGVDGIAEVMDKGQPLAKMIAVQVKATANGRYAAETDSGFSYLIRQVDLDYWRGSNLPVIIVLWRRSDDSFYWKDVPRGRDATDRRLQFDKGTDVLDESSINRLAGLTVPKAGFGYYVPPLGGGEEALVNILPIALPNEIFTATTPYNRSQAAAILYNETDDPRFDWIIQGGVFWSFNDPRKTSCCKIVDVDQVEAVETVDIAFHDDVDQTNDFIHLLRNTLRHQTRSDLDWSKDNRILYFKALDANRPRNFSYESSKKKTDANVVSVHIDKKTESISFVRHHAFAPRFERLGDQWYLVVSPTYFFTTNGYAPHQYPAALMAGKKRLDKSATLRGQVIMWHRYLTEVDRTERFDASGLFGTDEETENRLTFGAPPTVQLEIRVPEDGWGGGKKKADSEDKIEDLFA